MWTRTKAVYAGIAVVLTILGLGGLSGDIDGWLAIIAWATDGIDRRVLYWLLLVIAGGFFLVALPRQWWPIGRTESAVLSSDPETATPPNLDAKRLQTELEYVREELRRTKAESTSRIDKLQDELVTARQTHRDEIAALRKRNRELYDIGRDVQAKITRGETLFASLTQANLGDVSPVLRAWADDADTYVNSFIAEHLTDNERADFTSFSLPMNFRIQLQDGTWYDERDARSYFSALDSLQTVLAYIDRQLSVR